MSAKSTVWGVLKMLTYSTRESVVCTVTFWSVRNGAGTDSKSCRAISVVSKPSGVTRKCRPAGPAITEAAACAFSARSAITPASVGPVFPSLMGVSC